MRTISAQSITDTVARLCIKANTQLPQDVQAALEKAREEEPWPLAKNTLDLLWSNLSAAKEKDLPICQDTGMACVFVELGTDVHIDGSFEAAIHEGVRRGYTDGYLRKSIVAVDHVDFTIQNGSFCALVGESGSGKSTLAQLMCGLLVPSSGEVLFEGKNISLCRGKQKQVLRSKIQLILQDGKGAMDPRFTVYQIIAEPIRNFRKLSKKEEEREINDLLTMMELPEEIKLRKAHELSGGQQKRVCIARALAAQPDVLIFDEAVSGLDVLVRKHILDLLKRLHQERKMTCFFITHDLDVALYLADRVMVMRCGKIIEDRTFHGSTDCFTHPYTKLLLHSIAPYLG